jgi:SAM-dependent methyltransferase
MTDRTLSAADLSRLQKERTEADRAYNEALTALDRAIQSLPAIPHPPPDPDADTLDELARLTGTTPEPPEQRGGLAGWVARLVWSTLQPSLERQAKVNRAIHAHLAEVAARQQATAEAMATTLTLLQNELEALRAFQSRVVVWAQQITPYVDTKDREGIGLLRRVNENPVRLLERTIGLLQQRQQAMKRELEQLMAVEGSGSAPETVVAPGATRTDTEQVGRLDAYKYLGFEEVFRGSEAEIASRLAGYGDRFEGAVDVLDVGCGRGEFLSLLGQRGVTARGLDANPDMVAVCRERGLDVAEGDAVRYLQALPDEALGGLIATQVVEHFPSDYLLRFLELAYHKLRPGSTIILETLNVDSWSAFFGPYLRDITHTRPLPPETLRFLIEASGFQRAELVFSSPADDAAKLTPIDTFAPSNEELRIIVQAFNRNVDKINTLLFTFLDYAAIAQKL